MAKKTATVDLSQLRDFADQRIEFIQANPWLIPAGLAIEMIPLALLIHGHAKASIYKKKLQIEREKTKQLTIKAHSGHGHCHHHNHPKHKGHQHFSPAVPKQLLKKG